MRETQCGLETGMKPPGAIQIAPDSAIETKLALSVTCVSGYRLSLEGNPRTEIHGNAFKMKPTFGLAGRLLRTMNVTLLMFIVSMIAPSTSVDGQDEVAPDGSLSAEPYTVYVAHEEAFARCGPSGDFYRTDPLRHGQELEVYVETADGWLGIRPPDDSFCWIPASSVELSGTSDQATVTEDHTVAWIGTHLGRARSYRWQVQLAEGESVSIVGKSERDGPDGPQMWYRIVPPSGEFRWIHRDQIAASPEELVASVAGNQAEDDTIEFLPSPRSDRSAERKQLAKNELEPADVHSKVTLAANSEEQVGSSRRAAKPRESQSAQNQSEHNETPIGSGVRDDWQANETRDRAVDSLANRPSPLEVPVPEPIIENEVSPSSLSFVGAPRLHNIGTSYERMTPAVTEMASDANWVGSGSRQPSNANPNPTSRPAFAEQPGLIAQAAAFSDGPGFVSQTIHTVDTAAVARVESEAKQADIEKLQLMLSRIMAAGASSEEAEPIAMTAEYLARTSNDDLEARRAQAVADRTRQYQRVARRRDGHPVSQSSNPPMIPAANVRLSEMPPQPQSPFGTPAIPVSSRQGLVSSIPSADTPSDPAVAGNWISETGFLVQVYSARPNTPPFALTDNGGRTLAYVTPVPGTNLRMHLNNYIRIEGQRGFVNGMDTPHVMANRAQRVAQ